MWDNITIIMDICLCVQRCAVQAVGKCMARWLNLTNLLKKEKEDILEALQLCLRWKALATAQPATRQGFAQVISGGVSPAFHIPKPSKVQVFSTVSVGPAGAKTTWPKKTLQPPPRLRLVS